MLDLFLFCLCCSLAQLAIYISMNHQGMVLSWLKRRLDIVFRISFEGEDTHYATATGEYIAKPIYRCLVCMSSLWTILFWLAFVKPICVQMLFAVLICCGINKLICAFLEKATDYGC